MEQKKLIQEHKSSIWHKLKRLKSKKLKLRESKPKETLET